MTQDRVYFKELAYFNVPDGEILSSIRYNGEVYAGVRVGGAEADHKGWVYGRYDYHKELDYEGFWAFSASEGIQTTVSGLNVTGSEVEGEVFRIISGEDNTLELSVKDPQLISSRLSFTPSFEIRMWNASTGAAVVEATLPTVYSSGRTAIRTIYGLPTLNPDSYTVWARIAAQRPYIGLPPDYQQVTGRSPDDEALLWKDEATGKEYKFDELYCVGALPYDPQHPKRLAYEVSRAAGTLKKKPEWFDYFIELDSTGSERILFTEWAMIRVQVGSGQWVGEANVHSNASPSPSLMKLVDGALVPQPLRCSLRNVGSLKQLDDDLYIGSMEAGVNGRYASIIQSHLVESQVPALGVTGVAARVCECALINETIHSLTRLPDKPGGKVFGATGCDLFERVSLSPGKYTLIGKEPGGRSLTTIHPTSGKQWMIYAVEQDFAVNENFWKSYAYVVSESAEGTRVGGGVSALYDSVLCEWQGRCWGITAADPDLWEEGEYEKASKYQALCIFDGYAWKKIVRWPKSRYFMTRLASCGKQILLFGRQESNKLPTMMRYNGEYYESGIDIPYYIERADSTLSEDGKHEVCLMSCRKHLSSSQENDVEPGYFLVETTGLASLPPGEPGGPVEFPCVEDDSFGHCKKWCLPKDVLKELKVDYDSMVGCYTWSGKCWKKVECTTITTETGVWLEVVVGDTTVCFIRHGGPMPYSTDKHDTLIYDTTMPCVIPGQSCTDAECYSHKMPEGTTIYVGRYSLEEGTRLSRLTVMDALKEDLKEICYFWSAVWASVDEDIDIPIFSNPVLSPQILTQLKKFNIKLDYGEVTSLELPSTKWVTVVVFIPPTYETDLVIYPM